MKLPVFSSRDAQRMLNKIQAETVQTRELHARFYYAGKLITRFTLPGTHGDGRDLSIGERRSLQRASRLSRGDFIDLVNCPMGRDEYVAALKAMGHIPPD
ncbi:MAG: hypothetical protein OXG38_05605 [Chloroflexi bacterium]|nr:hypothetical protein [Chloroflexota bacterium]